MIKEIIGMLFLFILVAVIIAEAIFIIQAFFLADEIKCNYIWCEFTTRQKEATCTVNSIPVNCSEIRWS